LFCNGKRQVRARWPNHDPADPLYGGWAFVDRVEPDSKKATPGWQEPVTTIFSDLGETSRSWSKPEQGEVFIFPWLCWVNDIIPIGEADRDSGKIELTRSAWNTIMPGNRFRVENVREELDQPGEWCLDAETSTVYFWPPDDGPLDGRVSIPSNDRLIELKGGPDHPVRYIRIEGLAFTQTLSRSLVRGYAVQSDGFALYMENAEHCRISGNRFDQVGGDAIRLQEANIDNEISGNVIAHAGAQGICFNSTGEGNTHTWHKQLDVLRTMADSKPTASGNRIVGNHIHNCGVIEKHAAGIFFFNINAAGNLIANNRIHDVPRYAIALQIGLGGNVIEYNDIERTSLETADTGAIETNRWFVLEDREQFASGNIFRYNRVLETVGCGAYGKPREPMPESSMKAGGRIWAPYYSWGIYFDNSPMNVRVYGNLVVGTVLGGVMVLGAGKDVVFENNILVENSSSQMYYSSISSGGNYGPSEDIRFLRNIVFYSDPEALLIRIRKTPSKSIITESDANVYFNASGNPLHIDLPDVPRKDGFAKWKSLGYDANSRVADPLFQDPGNGDYRLRPGSPALELGFQHIPFNRIGLGGLQNSEHRASRKVQPDSIADDIEKATKPRETAVLKPSGLPLEKVRVCVTGYDHNRPDPFPGLGDFIGWVGEIVRTPGGELMFVHSAGYWHVSFATPVAIADENLRKSYEKWKWDPNHEAPTGGRIMAARSFDDGKTWSKPVTVYDGPLDAGPSCTFVTHDGTILQIVNVQASWYGQKEAPPGRQTLNTRQVVIRSTDNGETWSDPVDLVSSGTFYTRGRSRCLQLPDGGILWMSYDMDKGNSRLYGTIHRSDDDGKSWRVISNIRRDGVDTDEGDWGRLSTGRLVLVVRPDGGTLVSDDQGLRWKEISKVGPSYVYAPHLVVLEDDTIVMTAGGSGGQCIFLSTDGGESWGPPIRLDPGVYGYGKLMLMEDQTILLGYVWSGTTPNRCYLVRLRVNEARDGIELLEMGP
jgi:hypothetical protein